MSTQRGKSDSQSEQLFRAERAARRRLLAARGSVYAAFNNTACGLDANELAKWFSESPAGQAFGDQAGRAFGAALGVAIMAVESERALRKLGRWHVFR